MYNIRPRKEEMLEALRVAGEAYIDDDDDDDDEPYDPESTGSFILIFVPYIIIYFNFCRLF